MAIDATKIAKVKTAMDNRYENKQSNKKTTISGSYTGDNDSYPTVLACLNKFGELVTSWSAEPSDSKYPSEKLVKTALDNKISKSSTAGLVKNDGTIDTSTYLTQHQDISGKEDSNNKVTSWTSTTTDTHYPSEKLVKDSLDNKINTSDLVDNLSTNDATKVLSAKQGKALSDSISSVSSNFGGYINGIYQELSNNYQQKSFGSSNKNQNVVTNSSGVITVEPKPTIPSDLSDFTDSNNVIPSASNSTPTKDSYYGGVGLSTNYARADHSHPISDQYAKASHTHGSITNDGKIGTTSGKIITTGTDGALQASDSITTSMISDFPTNLSPTVHTHGAGDITDANAHSNLNTSANATQADINTAVDTLIGSLLAVDLIEVTADKGTASASTMNKLYLVAESSAVTNDAYEIFVTVRTGTSGNYSYAWEKIDTARIDLSGYINTAGTGLNKTGSTLNHSNSVTAVTTAAFKKIKYDAQGHITGTADVAASDLPSHTHSYTSTSDVQSEINQALDDLAEAIYPTSS